jgi:hypothetical protein
LAFSCSSSFNRRASDTVIPAYLAIQLSNVASEIPWRRHKSLVFAPASASFNTPMICSSLNRFAFMVRSEGSEL